MYTPKFIPPKSTTNFIIFYVVETNESLTKTKKKHEKLQKHHER